MMDIYTTNNQGFHPQWGLPGYNHLKPKELGDGMHTVSETLSVEELIQETKTGNISRVVNALMDEFYTPVYRVSMSILQDPDDADDITQETFITAIKKLNQYRPNTNFKAWIFTIAVNKCKDKLRKQKRRQNNLMQWRTTIYQEQTRMDPENYAVDNDMKERLWNVVNKLGEKHRITIILRFVHDLPIREIANILDINEGTVHSRLFYAEKKLQHIIREELPELER